LGFRYYDEYNPQLSPPTTSASTPTKPHSESSPSRPHYDEPSPEKRKPKTYSTSRELYRTTPAPALRQMLLKEEKETRDLRRLLNKALLQLRASKSSPQSRGHSHLSDAQNIVEHSKLMDGITDARLATTKAQHEADVNKALLDNAKNEVETMRRRLKLAEEERDEAVHSASKARAIARRLREEKDIMFAHEEGRRRGFDEGLERAKWLAMSQKLLVYQPQEDQGGGIARIEEHDAVSSATPSPPRTRSSKTDSSQPRKRERQVSDPPPPPPPVEQPKPAERRRRHSVDTGPQRPPSAESRRAEPPPIIIPSMPEPAPAPPFELEYVRMPSPPVQRPVQRSSMPFTPPPLPVPPPARPASRTHKRNTSDTTLNSPASTMTGISSTLDHELLSFPEQQQQQQQRSQPPHRRGWPGITRTLSDIPEARTPTPSQSSRPSPNVANRNRVDEWRRSSSSVASPPNMRGPPDDFFLKPVPSPAKPENLVERHDGSIVVDVFAPVSGHYVMSNQFADPLHPVSTLIHDKLSRARTRSECGSSSEPQ